MFVSFNDEYHFVLPKKLSLLFNSIIQSFIFRDFGNNKKVETHFGFWFPNISKLDIRFKNRHMVIYEHFYEVDENIVCMCQITLWKNILGFMPLTIAKKFMLNKSINIVQEDIAFLENNKRIKKETGKSDLLIKSDEVTFEFMKLWKRKTINL